MNRILLGLALCLAVVLPARAQEPLTVFAAASLKTALDEIATSWQAQGGSPVDLSYAGSSALARQIEAGAPADVFLSAAENWMDLLDQAGRLQPGTRVNLLGNRLVLVAHGSSVPVADIEPGLDLAGLLSGGKLAMALVDAVPAGQYGKAALVSLGLWDAVAPSVAQADNVRAALALVARGEAPFGIVYATDVAAEIAAGGEVSAVGTFPEDSHPPIVYPGAVIDESTHPEASAFLDYLSSPGAADVFRAQGFTILAPGG
jgi:molybdate transport system substrate-binding protein